ncbi:hypothetical protein ABC255_02215 [Neobacillus sp. 3P2-tot-E-2]|uniref:DUF7713 domain-containing protein n=1 Tax=Neobacillus sp. 3P2-tot-E-2 TaxID=3132212 RepID=UPI0039A133AD
MNKCERCGSNNTKVHLTMDEGTMHLCMDCYNQLLSEELEVDLEPLIESFSLKDYQGISRTFIVERRLDPLGIFLEAVENIDFGYKFAVYGDLNDNQFVLLNKLIEKVGKGIGKQQVERKVFPNGQPYNTIIDGQFTGLIEYDETADGTPLIIIDGKPYKWGEVGKMLMAYEGFQIKLKMVEVTDDVE